MQCYRECGLFAGLHDVGNHFGFNIARQVAEMCSERILALVIYIDELCARLAFNDFSKRNYSAAQFQPSCTYRIPFLNSGGRTYNIAFDGDDAFLGRTIGIDIYIFIEFSRSSLRIIGESNRCSVARNDSS